MKAQVKNQPGLIGYVMILAIFLSIALPALA